MPIRHAGTKKTVSPPLQKGEGTTDVITKPADWVVKSGPDRDVELMAHLYRRAGFGATYDELRAAGPRGYEAIVESLLRPEDQPAADLDLFDRYFPEGVEGRRVLMGAQGRLIFRMLTTPRPLEEKMTLFWHGLFATGNAKLTHPWPISTQLETFRRHCLADFRTILLELCRDPAMVYWLDNQLNTKDVHNENFGRELLELFSMGIGNYTEDDVKSCSRAFTGWTVRNPGLLQPQAYGRYHWEYVFRPELHDYTEKEFLGSRGTFDGTDVIDIIVRHPATAYFIAKRLYLFFVSDEPDVAAIAKLAEVFATTGGDIRAVIRSLLLSEAFRSPQARFAMVKSPIELVVGVARLVGGFEAPSLDWGDLSRAPRRMGQDLLNPPSVEGWHTGAQWIDSGLLLERVNFAASLVGDLSRPGVRMLVNRIYETGPCSPAELVERGLELIGPLPVTDETRCQLERLLAKDGAIGWQASGRGQAEARIARLLSLMVASREYQFN